MNKRDWITTDLLDVRFQDGVGSDLQERHVLGAEFLNDLVEGSTKKDGLTNVVPAVLNVQIPLEPLSVDGRHDFGNELPGCGQGALHEVLEYVLLSFHERGMESARNAKLGVEDLFRGIKRTRTVDFGIKPQQIPIRRKLLARRHSGSQFPVHLTILLICPNETCSARIRGSQQNQVGRHSLVLFEQNQVADMDREDGTELVCGPLSRDDVTLARDDSDSRIRYFAELASLSLRCRLESS